MGDFQEALLIFRQVIADKAEYQQLLAGHPWWTEGGGSPGGILDKLHADADAGRLWLGNNGYGAAAAVLAADSEQDAAAWLVENPDLGTGLSGGLPSASPPPPPGLQGLRDSYGTLAAWSNSGMSAHWWKLQGVIEALG